MRDLSPEDAKLMEGLLERLTGRKLVDNRREEEDPEAKDE